jgi:hypothetical protein
MNSDTAQNELLEIIAGQFMHPLLRAGSECAKHSLSIPVRAKRTLALLLASGAAKAAIGPCLQSA